MDLNPELLKLRPVVDKNDTFHSRCKHKKFRNMYCMDCGNSEPLCSVCSPLYSKVHKGHNFFQVKKSTKMNAINVSEIVKYAKGFSGVYEHKNNGKKVVLIKTRLSEDEGIKCNCSGADASGCCCRKCGYVFCKQQDSARYCSLECCIKELEEMHAAALSSSNTSSCETSERPRLLGIAASSRRISRRKGIPCRAPFF